MTDRIPALVIGAGISGLVCAYALRKAEINSGNPGIDAHIVESAPQAGGMIRSQRCDGYLLEYGPQSFNATAPIRELGRELHIDNQLVQAPAHAPRFVLINGQLRPVPLSPPAFMASSLFSLATKSKVLRDVFGRTNPPDADESIAAFVRRKFSAELLEKLVGPFVSGIYAGDPEKLSARSAFPSLYEAEKSAGSVIRGLLRGAKKPGQPTEKPTLQTFRDGNQTLIDALVSNLGSKLRCGTEVRRIRLSAPTTTSRESPATASSVFEVTLSIDGHQQTLQADRLIIATPTQQAAALLRELDPRFESSLQPIQYAPVAVVSLGYPKTAVRHSLEGFGFLVPRSSGLRILGTVWNSSLFPCRAPDGNVLLTSFIGGALAPEVVTLSESEITAAVHRELAPILGISLQQPTFSHVQLWPRAIPQYQLGHAQHIARLAALHAQYPNLHFTGNYLHGPAIGACIEQALTTARQAGTN